MSEIKYFVFFLALIVGVPVGYYLALHYRLVERLVFFLFVFFTCEMVDINFVSMETYRGTSKGFEFGLVDISMYIVLLLALSRRNEIQDTSMPPGTTLFVLYFVLSLASIMHADVLVYSGFEILKMSRMFLYFCIAYWYLQQQGKIDELMQTVAIIIVYIFFSVVKQKYLYGMYQAMGPFPHQNSLTMYISILGALAFSKTLNCQQAKPHIWLVLFGMVAFCIVATLSRAGLALFAINCSIILALSLLLKDPYQQVLKRRKYIILAILPILGTAFILKASDSIVERFNTAPKESAHARIFLAQAAVKMANENVLGVGLNNFAHKINDPYPYGEHIPVEVSRNSERRGLVETAYLMIAAEAGWITLAVFMCFLFYFWGMNVSNIIRLKGHPYRYIAIALLGALTQVYLQTTLEWVIKQTNNFYQLMLMFALIAALRALCSKVPAKTPNVARETPVKVKGGACVTTI